MLRQTPGINTGMRRNLSGFALPVPKQMAGAIWDGLMRSSA